MKVSFLNPFSNRLGSMPQASINENEPLKKALKPKSETSRRTKITDMKKALILIIAAICTFQINGFAQKTMVGLTGGTTFSNVYGNRNALDVRGDARQGYTLGMFIDAPIGKTRWAFQPSLNYMQKGKNDVIDPYTTKATALRYAELDMNFVHYTKAANKLFFGVGPYLAMNLPSKTVLITQDSRIETNLLMGKDPSNTYKGYDYGANGIIGLRLKNNLVFTANYSLGLRNLIPEPKGDDILRNGTLGFRIGYIFKNTNSGTPKAKKEKTKKK